MRGRRPSKIDVTLFPFLSVLCAMIGVMMLFLILVISSRVIEAEERQGQASEGEPSQGESSPDPLSEADLARLEEEWRALDHDRQQLEADRDELLRLRDELRDQEAIREDPLPPVGEARVGRRFGERERRLFVPDAAFGAARRPRFVEVSAEGLLAHPHKKRYAFTDLTRGGKPLDDLLGPLARGEVKEYLLLLVHPNGADTYHALREHLRKEYADGVPVGVEPFAAEWLLVEP